ncbi:MAG: TIGR02757 family protein [Bacteroidetes bacterium]|nr:TIGR02757 family protein [Bacteroidota bacterium]MDA1344239.1 TIGR02757 family protein [Bacteroidota bacterium]
MNKQDLKQFLEEKAQIYEHPRFLDTDPIQIPHQYQEKQDIEIAAFLAATIAWGNRKSIINSAEKMLQLMGNSPFDFTMNHTPEQLKNLKGFVHRTFNGDDFVYFVKALKHLLEKHQDLEAAFVNNNPHRPIGELQYDFRSRFLSLNHEKRTEKHLANPLSGSAAKRINMFLRWMVRSNRNGVDFGLWQSLLPRQLSIPLDVHSGNVARKLKLLKRTQNDAKSVIELDQVLSVFDPDDPVKYDFALFGLGVFEKF